MFGRLFGGRKSRQVIAALGEGDRFCKDCKWCRPVVRMFVFRYYDFSKCANPKWVTILEVDKKDLAMHYVDERPIPRARGQEIYCSTMRQEDLHICGSKGIGWEPK